MRKATVHNRHTKIHFIQSTPIHLLVCYGSNYGSHVTAAEVDELCVRKDHNADAKKKEKKTPAVYTCWHHAGFSLPALLLAVSGSSIMQHLRRRARQTLQNLMKDEIAAFACPEILPLIP